MLQQDQERSIRKRNERKTTGIGRLPTYKFGRLRFGGAQMSLTVYSFIMEIYTAPLQGYYSEALPTLARLKRRVLRLE